MIKIVFANCSCVYDNHVAIFFDTIKNIIRIETLKNQLDINGVDLRGGEIKKNEFDHILNIYEEFVKTNKITIITNTFRQNEVENYLGALLKHNECIPLMHYCAKYGLLDILKYAYGIYCKFDNSVCEIASKYGQIDCLEYACKNGSSIDIEYCRKIATGDCIKYFEKICL